MTFMFNDSIRSRTETVMWRTRRHRRVEFITLSCAWAAWRSRRALILVSSWRPSLLAVRRVLADYVKVVQRDRCWHRLFAIILVYERILRSSLFIQLEKAIILDYLLLIVLCDQIQILTLLLSRLSIISFTSFTSSVFCWALFELDAAAVAAAVLLLLRRLFGRNFFGWALLLIGPLPDGFGFTFWLFEPFMKSLVLFFFCCCWLLLLSKALNYHLNIK